MDSSFNTLLTDLITNINTNNLIEFKKNLLELQRQYTEINKESNSHVLKTLFELILVLYRSDMLNYFMELFPGGTHEFVNLLLEYVENPLYNVVNNSIHMAKVTMMFQLRQSYFNNITFSIISSCVTQSRITPLKNYVEYLILMDFDKDRLKYYLKCYQEHTTNQCILEILRTNYLILLFNN